MNLTGQHRSRDIVLTTLIDLLVQIVFIFSILFYIFSVASKDKPQNIEDYPEYWRVLREAEECKKKLDGLNVRCADIKAESKLVADGRAVGKPSCKISGDGKTAMRSFNISASRETGELSLKVVATPEGERFLKKLDTSLVSSAKFEQEVSLHDFKNSFGRIGAAVHNEHDCRLVIKMIYDVKTLTAEDLLFVQSVVYADSYFTNR